MDVHLKYVTSVHAKVITEPGILMELADAFTWYAPNYRFNPKYKRGIWDGRISLVNRLSGQVYAGLAHRIKKFCDSRDYTFSFDPELAYSEVTEETIQDFISSLNVPPSIEARDYQLKSILKCIQSHRRTLLSPTNSGKSFIIYVLIRWYQEQYGIKPLVVVPSIQLVNQLASDFYEYGYTGTVHKSTDGLSTSTDIESDLVITTWQSLDNGKTKKPKSWYQQFGMVVGDEAHTYTATCAIRIFSNLTQCKYRFGTTGTLADDKLNQATLEGLFGAQYVSSTNKELISKGYSSKLKIKCIVLKYPDELKKLCKTLTYHDELNLITTNEARLDFISKLSQSLNGNKLIFFRLIDHGKAIFDKISEHSNSVHYIDGSISSDEREAIKQQLESETGCTLVGSLGTTSTGVNIKHLHHMLAASPSKSKIKVLQSIGRMLRTHETKTHATLYDIVDDLSWKNRTNYTMLHFYERIKMYDAEEFDYEIIPYKLK